MKTVLVTGGSRGIGKAIAKNLGLTCNVAVGYSNSKEQADEVVDAIKTAGGNAIAVSIDVTDQNSVDECFETVEDVYSSVDILINNAGITGSTSSLWDYDVDEWNKIIEINLMGTFNCCKTVVPYMIKNNYGRIVNVASVAGKDGNANASAYSSAKAGVIGLTKSLGKELADKNIAVNAVTPAGAKTRILDQMTKEHVQRMLSKVPRGRFLEIHEFTSLVCWLSSEENSFSTAAVFDISGGRSTY